MEQQTENLSNVKQENEMEFSQKAATLDAEKKDVTHNTSNGTSENGGLTHSDSNDSMPDLLWPDNPKERKSKGTANVTSSSSHDTGFGSDSVGQTPSPDEADKKVEESLNQKDGDTNGTEKDGDSDESGEIDILGNGLLKKKVIVEGKGIETRPTNGDIVTLTTEGLLEDGRQIDKGEVTFILNDGDVILAFDLGVSLMEVGETCELFTAPRYAYGELGRSPDVPKDANITYTLELVNVQPALEPSAMTCEERLEKGEAKRERGNYLYGRGDYSGAINSYSKAVKLLDNPDLNTELSEESHSSLMGSWVKCYNNMAACQLKISALDAAIRSCEKVLAWEENNVKALFRLGKAYGQKGEVENALKYLRSAIKLDPESKMLHQEMLNLNRQKKKETESQKELYQRMLGVKQGENPFITDKKKNKSSSPLMKWTLLAGGVTAVLVSIGLTMYRTS